MDVYASITTLPLQLAGNQVIVSIEPPDPVASRAELAYQCEIYKPEAFGSGFWQLYQKLTARESPAHTFSGVTYIDPVNFDIADFLYNSLESTPPDADQTSISQQPNAVMPFYVKTYVDPLSGTTTKTSPIQFALRAKLNETQFARWRDVFFTNHFKNNRPFLTWQPKTDKVVDRAQPEFLSFLVHHDPKPQELRLRLEVHYTGGIITDLGSPITLTSVDNFTVYTVPVGFKALGLDALEAGGFNEVHAYRVWLSNENNERLTEVRRYIVNQEYTHHVRYITFCNSLGGWDTLRMTGLSFEQLNIISTTFQRQLSTSYKASDDEVFVFDSKGVRTLVVNTGDMPDATWLAYLEELAWSEKVYVLTKEGYMPIVRTSNVFDLPSDDEYLNGRTFSFRMSKDGKAFSNLGEPPTIAARPTMWIPVFAYCETASENGKRTGRQAYAKLELHYADGAKERCLGIARKDNIPGTEGYVAPQHATACSSAAYLNVSITCTGSVRRNNCASGLVGDFATIHIPAGSYGSETSQADADKRAQDACNALDTQEYANTYGACILGVVEIEMENGTNSSAGLPYYAPLASGGYVSLGTGNPSEWIESETFNLPITKTWNVEVAYYCDNGHVIDVLIDGAVVGTLTLPAQWPYFGGSVVTPGTATISLAIPAGDHTIRFRANATGVATSVFDKVKFS